MLVLLCVVSSSSVFAFSFNPPNKLTGAPGESNCTQCHTGNDINAAGGSLMLTVPGVYTPGMEYDIVVELTRAGQSKWGFQMTALNSIGTRAGTFAISNANTQQLEEQDSKQYIEHKAASGTNRWAFKWTAPSTDVGQITFYAAGNAANNADLALGDYIYTQRATSDSPAYDVSLAGVGSLNKTVNTGIETRYTLTVRNTGNSRDTISLSTSGIASASLNQSSVTLDAEASANVTLTIPGSALTSAGEYKATVTASSQGDSSKSAEVTTTTTILPAYNVSLAGVGSLTRQTTDASNGVRYTVKVTNDGNTTDTIRLSTSGDASATISPSPVTLSAGASRNLSLTVSDSKLAQAGEYNVKVTATSQNDSSKTAEITTTTTILPVYNIAIEGVGELTTETTDASDGVSYALKITNNGNTNDTIDLATSGTAATLSQESVSLASGASAEVMLTISGDVLALADSYAVKVTATSQGDDTQTVEITTTTTILPVYDIALEGIGELTTETADASDGVSYTLKVTNNGNTDDTIDLVTSGTAATLSQASVSLASGASADVMLTISGDVLALADSYVVKVTATSQGDDTQTVEITTTTTILPVYDIALEGVGDLTTEITDVSDGVSYALKITNNGNTDDTIDLATSGTAAMLSQTSVSLASGASAEVMLTISGDVLALADSYAVKVTATSQGDATNTAEITTTTTILPVYDISLEGVGDLTTETADASDGVSYALKITNNGNTDDTIDLATSSTDATLSQASVSLASGASADVMLTISGDVLALADSYAVKVTATSQGDATNTAEITTTTTILPVYDISLEGVGDLTTETTDASEGVSYALKITNNGNTDDVIDLATSSTAATLSQESVSLASGASAEVMLTISGALLALADSYEVQVTATSQGDDTQTVEITTTTTVLPVYGVTLASDTLTGATTEANIGVTYTLTLTNTGNTDDTIVLGSSAEVGITGAVLGAFNLPDSEEPDMAQLEIMLAAGESAEVAFIASGDLLTQPGEYEIMVTATSQGDTTKTAVITTTTTITAVPPEYGVMLEGKDELTGETMDILTGVTYTLIVTNTGNTDDTIVLSSSAEVGIEGSVLGSFSQSDDQEMSTAQLQITLAAGETVEVKFTAAGDFFTKSGVYEIMVTATSQGDTTKTAVITTTTTIPPEYGVMLEGKDELTGASWDYLTGVTYALTVTNTGNTEDTIVLSSSAEVGIEGSVLGSFSLPDSEEVATSQLQVTLAADESVEVNFTAAGDFFTKIGEYGIVVTATSQGDTTKTAEVTTTTTIEPVPWDLNADGTVNILDLVAVANQFGETGEGLSGDVNMDGTVNILDLVAVANQFGKSQAEIVQAANQ